MNLIVSYKYKKEMVKKMKKNKIIGFIWCVTCLIIILQIVSYLRIGKLNLKLNSVYKDIETLEDKINIYYLDNGNLPVKENSLIDFYMFSQNPNDNKNYYQIDLNKLENVKLSYGNELTEKDVYIINEQSHTIYYYKGIECQGKTIYTKNLDYEYVDLEKYQ